MMPINLSIKSEVRVIGLTCGKFAFSVPKGREDGGWSLQPIAKR